MLPVGDLVPPVEAAGPPARRPYRGEFVHLIPVSPDDAPELFAAAHGSPQCEGLWTYMPVGPFSDAAHMRSWLEEIAGGDDPLYFTVRRVDPGDAVGMVSFLSIDPPHRRLELGNIWYAPEAQRTKVNTEAMWLMLEEAFGPGCCRRVEWKCDALNARSRAAAQRLGFTFEGIFRKHRIVRGRNRDTAWFALVDDDWPRVRANMRRWLYENEAGELSLAALNHSP
jgi:RimJ/RimL family protein N-acetyltransferase